MGIYTPICLCNYMSMYLYGTYWLSIESCSYQFILQAGDAQENPVNCVLPARQVYEPCPNSVLTIPVSKGNLVRIYLLVPNEIE
jgi:hypothetical protein